MNTNAITPKHTTFNTGKITFPSGESYFCEYARGALRMYKQDSPDTLPYFTGCTFATREDYAAWLNNVVRLECTFDTCTPPYPIVKHVIRSENHSDYDYRVKDLYDAIIAATLDTSFPNRDGSFELWSIDEVSGCVLETLSLNTNYIGVDTDAKYIEIPPADSYPKKCETCHSLGLSYGVLENTIKQIYEFVRGDYDTFTIYRVDSVREKLVGIGQVSDKQGKALPLVFTYLKSSHFLTVYIDGLKTATIYKEERDD